METETICTFILTIKILLQIVYNFWEKKYMMSLKVYKKWDDCGLMYFTDTNLKPNAPVPAPKFKWSLHHNNSIVIVQQQQQYLCVKCHIDFHVGIGQDDIFSIICFWVISTIQFDPHVQRSHKNEVPQIGIRF